MLLGLVGQLAWTVENMYLNVFVHETITDNPNVLALLVSTSAAAATLATLLVGAWSDRTGRRREFIAIGYVLWGLTTAGFGLVSPDRAGDLAPAQDAVVIAVISIVLLDCVMSFLGSGANDAAYQAWVTDNTTPANRGKVDGVIQAMPLLAMLLVFGALDPMTQDGHWRTFFAVVGGVTALVVVGYGIGLLLMFAARGMLWVILAGTVAIGGFLLAVAALSATVRNLTPADRVGQVQGLRMIAAILVPSAIGPFIGAAVISGADETYVDLGVTKQVPTPWIFVAAAAVALFVVLPLRVLRSDTAETKDPEEVSA